MSTKNEFFCHIQERKCHKCGKSFIPGAEHIYKDHSRWYCCWTCYLHRKDKDKPPSPATESPKMEPIKTEFIIPRMRRFEKKTKEE